jgi:hypothetical protein
MSAVIIAKSDQWNADDFVEGPRTFTIEAVQIRPGTEQPVQITLAGSKKFFRPCKTVSRVLVAAWKADANAYIGRSLTLYTDPDVTWGGMKVGGIRISHMSHIDRPLVIALQEKKGSKRMTTIQPLKVEPRADELTLEGAELSLRLAKTLDELKAAWSKKAMASFRPQLQAVLDERKAALSMPAGEGPADTQRGETNAGEADDLIDLFQGAADEEAYERAKKAFEVMRPSLSDEAIAAVEIARDAAADRVLA